MADQQLQPSKRRRGCFKCDICQQKGINHSTVYPTVLGLKRHIFSTHLHEKGFLLQCRIDNCPIEVNSRRNLYSHVGKSHPGREWRPCFSNILTDAHIPSPGSEELMDEITTVEVPNPVMTDQICVPHEKSNQLHVIEDLYACTPITRTDDTDTVDDEDVQIFKQMMTISNEQRQISTALSIAELKANYNLSQVALEAAQKWAEGLLTNVAQTLIGGVKLVNSGRDPSLTLDDVFEFGEGMTNPFHGLSSEWMLKKILEDKLGYVEPETVILHEAVNEGLRGQTKVYTMQYVPILEVLKLLYQDKNFRMEISKRKPATSGLMTDFMDGGYYKQHPLFRENPNALQLQLYYDGFEVTNPLGSKTQRHNVGALYFSILNLDPTYRSTLKSICLAGLLFEKDVKHPQIGWEVILRRFNSDLKALENGIHFTVDDNEEVFVQGTIAQCALDNKAAHSLFGMQDSFIGNNISRYCLCSSEEIQNKVMSRECVIRNRESFDGDLATLELTGQPANGVKSRCFLDSVYFHRADAFAADIHHDVLEGLIPGMLKPILQELILKKHFFTIHLLNSRISNFDYNSHDAKNRPSVITEAKLKEDSRSLKQYASQYWCLLRKLPLIIGDQVLDGDEHWSLLLQLVDVVDLIMSPKVDDGTLDYLEMQLSVLFKGFKDQFPDVRLTPKMHYTLHYPRLMKEVGPLIRHWVMRFEAKHHFFKRAAILSGNYINIPRTLAVRHQMLQVVHVHQGGLLRKDVSVADGHPVGDIDLPLGAEITVLLNDPRPTICTKVNIHGTAYRIGDVIFTGFDTDDFVQLGEIQNIIVSTAKVVCFSVQMLRVIEFDEHFHLWKIEKPNDPEVIALLYGSLPDYHPVSVHYTFGNDSALHASFRYNVRCSDRI